MTAPVQFPVKPHQGRAEQARQITIALLGLPAIWFMICAGEWARWGVLLGLAAQPFWLVSTYRARQMGMYALAWAYLLVWLRGAWIHWRYLWA